MTKLNIALAAVCVIALAALACVTKACVGQKGQAERLESTVSNYERQATRLKVALNDSTTVMAARVNDLEFTRRNIQARYDSLLNACGIKAKDVNHVTSVKTVVQDKVVEVPVLYDSFGGIYTTYSDDFTSISVDIDTLKHATIDYYLSDSLTVINTQKRHRLLFGLIKWTENLQTTVLSANPKMRIMSVTSVNKIE